MSMSRGFLLSTFSIVFLSLAFATAPHIAGAAQMGVDIAENGSFKMFNYKVRTYDRTVKDIGFKMRARDLSDMRNYVPNLSDARIQQKIDRAIASINSVHKGLRKKRMESVVEEIEAGLPSGVELSFRVDDNEYSYSLRYPRSMSEAEVEALKPPIQKRLGVEWRAMNTEYSDDVEERLEDNWDRIIGDDPLAYMMSSDGQFYPALDYIRISNDFRREMRPLSDAIKQVSDIRNERTMINDALSFFQSIPYNNFQTRNVKAGGSFGYVVPTTLLELNEGDCDTKSTAMAATLMNLVPNRDVIMLLLPKHALLGIYTPYKQPGDVTFRFRNRDYVLMEPTSEGYPLGKIFSQSAQYINAGQIDRVMWLTR